MTTTLTPAQLEAAARKYCELQGLDPYNIYHLDVAKNTLARYLNIETAIAHALGNKE